jgi:hypothetical protein
MLIGIDQAYLPARRLGCRPADKGQALFGENDVLQAEATKPILGWSQSCH